MKKFLTVLLINILVMQTGLGMEFRPLVWRTNEQLPKVVRRQLDLAKFTGELSFDFDKHAFTPSEIELLAREIAKLSKTQTIHFYGVPCSEPILHALNSLPNLQVVDFADCPIETARILYLMLRTKKLVSIRSIPMESVTNTSLGRHIFSVSLAPTNYCYLKENFTDALRTTRSLHDLDLSKNLLWRLSPTDWRQLFFAIPDVKKLDLSVNNLFKAPTYRSDFGVSIPLLDDDGTLYMTNEPYMSFAVHRALAESLMLSHIEELDMSGNFAYMVPEFQKYYECYMNAFAHMPRLKKLRLNISDCDHSPFVNALMYALLLNRNKPILVVTRGQETATLIPGNYAPEMLSNTFMFK